MYKFLNVLMLGAALTAPVALQAQDHGDRSYEDRAHHDSHTWNHDEDARYRDYLREHHKKYRDFSKMSHRDQDAYWNWRHRH